MAEEEGEGEPGDTATVDPRLDVIEQYALKTMKLKHDKWAKVRNNNFHT